jgi:ubiquinol-cytochrome c reductase cytochrome b subunit
VRNDDESESATECIEPYSSTHATGERHEPLPTPHAPHLRRRRCRGADLDIIERLFVIHILLLPAAIAGLLGAHLFLLVRQKHTQFRGPGRREDNVVGEVLWPTYAAKALGLFFLVAAVLAALGGLAQINPVWVYGPFRTANVSTLSQPDWYMGWLEGAMRLMPPWEIRAFGFEVPNPFFPGVLIPGITFGLLLAWPFLEARFSGDKEEHHVLDRPRDRPLRTALGMATLAFYTVLGLGGASDALATLFDVSVNRIIWILRILVFVVPVTVAVVTRRLCLELQARDALEDQEDDEERELVDA